MAGHPHAELARTLWKAVSASDVDALEALTTDDVQWHASGRGPRSGTYRGRAVILDYLARIGEDVERFDSELEDVLVGDRGVALLTRVEGNRNGHELRTGFVLLLRVEDGRVAEVWAVPRDQHAVDAFWQS